MKNGGAWMGFQFSAFALTPSKYPQNWDWYHNENLASGIYVGNTWRPTSAIRRLEDTQHPATVGLPATFQSAPNEWYKWSKDLKLGLGGGATGPSPRPRTADGPTSGADRPVRRQRTESEIRAVTRRAR